ncbi:hypothetical protein [Devosia sp.]|uniref:hypothetical protein n=1 Tax=Devosia sp. TaxID=1871048 RepID=UPI0019FFC0B5|nr:hypothetical protein [Devosia sp.]MBE0578631.1 hypothetical protein [Devosia sp.]
MDGVSDCFSGIILVVPARGAAAGQNSQNQCHRALAGLPVMAAKAGNPFRVGRPDWTWTDLRMDPGLRRDDVVGGGTPSPQKQKGPA